MFKSGDYANIPVILSDRVDELTTIDYIAMAAFSFHELFNRNNVIAVADTSKYRVYIPGSSIDHKLKAGDKLVPGSTMYQAVTSKTRVSVRHDSSLFGFPYIGTACPVFGDNGEVVGGIILCENIKHLEELNTAAENLNEVTEQVVNMVSSLEQFNNSMEAIRENLSRESNDSLEKIQSTDKFLTLIKGIGNQTNILGINASIEAARAGESGAGFAVVANEIRKLSDESLQSVKIINETLKDIKLSSNNVNQEVVSIGGFVQEQTDIVQQLLAVVQHLHSVAETLQQQAEEMVSR